MARLFSPGYDPAHDCFASTVDDISSWYHVQSISKGGTRFNDLVAPSAANFPDALAGTPSRYFLYVPMRMDRSDLAGSRPIVIKDETSATTLTRVTGSPSNNEYRIAPENSIRRNTIELHSGQAGHTISYDYYGEGSMFTAEEWNKKQWVNYHTITADYTVLDDDWYREIHVPHTTSTAKVTVLLPTAVANNGRRIRVQNTGVGFTLIDGEGAETISLFGNSLTTILLLMEDDYAELFCNGTEWKVEHYYCSMKTNGIGRADWTNCIIGSSFQYDTKSASVDFTGQHITIADGGSLQKAVVLYDSGGTAASGILYVYAITDSATSKGCWTDNQVVTCGVGGYTVAVDEGSGSSKNNTSNIYHGLGINYGAVFNFCMKIYAGTTYQEATAAQLHMGPFDRVADRGCGIINLDSNNCRILTQASGVDWSDSANNAQALDNDDYSFSLEWAIKI